jgi:hypothetical protein
MARLLSQEETSQLPIGRLKTLSRVSWVDMLLTLGMPHPPVGWLKAEFPQNMQRMSVSLETSKFPIGWVKGVMVLDMRRVREDRTSYHQE